MVTWLVNWWRTRKNRVCFHHDPVSALSYIDSELIDLGRGKAFWCTNCNWVWLV